MLPPNDRESGDSGIIRLGAAKLLADARHDAAPSQISALAARAIEQLTHHLAQFVGEAGVRALLARSAALASAQYPWLADTLSITTPVDDPWASLRAAMEQQDPRAIRDGFVALLSIFVELLGRLIGESLVWRLLDDVWPALFSRAVKETT